jgi:UDP-N-acetylmuramoylalanine--D-glutamate ligase
LSFELKSVSDLRGKRVTVMGLGLNGGGLASARFLAKAGALVTVTDMKDENTLAPSIEALKGLNIRYALGRHDQADFDNADIVIKNPAVPPSSPYLANVKHMETDISLFLRFCPAPIYAVTGSKGKSSTASALYYGFKEAGKEAFLGGNITVSPLDFIDRANKDTPVVLELSSWQLADMRGMGVLKPKVAILTAIMPDHMNRYSSMDEYVADKRLIYADQDQDDITICGADDAWGESFARESKARVLRYSASKQGEGFPGAYLDGGAGYSLAFSSAPELIVPADTVMPGPHQKKNLLAAGLALRSVGIEASVVARAMGSFAGVEHRLEGFKTWRGIRFYNDSAATIPQAVCAALESFTESIHLITGGTDKALDFSVMQDFVGKPKSLSLLSGSGTDKLIPLLRERAVAYEGPFDNIQEAVAAAAGKAREGEIVLLSPGCTSFGMFQNEFDRGRKFKAAVEEYCARQ